MWTSAARIAPAAAAAAALTQPWDWNREGLRRRFLGAQRQGMSLPTVRPHTNCQDTSTSKAHSWGTIVRSVPGESTKKGLLGQSHWIYRLVCSQEIQKVYHLERELGRGASGTVFLGRHREMGYHRAVKKIPKGDSVRDQNEMMNEIYTLMDLDHPHIIQLLRMHDDGQFLYIVSELCSGPSLWDRLMASPMSEQEAAVALRHMLKAVQCCHAHYMGHYDIKPENFMYSEPSCTKLKMIDLGLSSGFKRDASEFKGTVHYMAPEVLVGMYGPEADIWSCGVVLFAMATRSSLCPADATEEEFTALLQDRRWVKQRLAWGASHASLSTECIDLLSKMLCYDRHMRITAADALTHPYITNTYLQPKRSRKDRKEDDAAVKVVKSMVDMFEDFGAEPVLVRAALLVMVHIAGYASTETKAHRLAYSMLDRAGTGELSVDSIEAMMPKYGLAIPPNLDDAFGCVDLNQNGYITYGNFLSATLPLSLRCREDIGRRVFSLLDQNHDGFVDAEDLAATFFSKAKMRNEGSLKLCQQAIMEVSGSPSKVRLDLEQFLRVIVGSHSPIT